MSVRTEARFGGPRLLIRVAFLSQFNVYGGTTYRHPNGLADRSVRPIPHNGRSHQAFILHAALQRVDHRGAPILIKGVLGNAICKGPVNVCIRSERGSECL